MEFLKSLDYGYLEGIAAFAVFLWFTRREVRGQFKGLQTSFDTFNKTFTQAIHEVKDGLAAFGKQIIVLEECHGERIMKVEAEINILKAERVLKVETDLTLLKKQYDDLKSALTDK